MTRFAASRYAGWEAEDLPAVKFFARKEAAVGETVAHGHQILRLCSPIIGYAATFPNIRAAKCHKIYNDIIPQMLKLVNS